MASSKSRLKRFIHKHERWLTFVGAFIVFITFVVKEGLGEHWRGIADALNSARYTYELQKQSSDIRADIDELRHIVQTRKALAESIPEDTPAGVAGFAYESPTFFSWYSENLAAARDALHDASTIAEKLPPKDEETQKVSALSAELPKAEEELSDIQQEEEMTELENEIKIMNGKNTASNKKRHNPETDQKSKWVYHSFQRPSFKRTYEGEDPFAARVNVFSGSVLEFRSDADKLTENTLLRVEKTLKRNEQRATFARWLSTALFAIGWGLALLGKLYGVPGAAGAD